jgi:hypothetical protein
MFHMKHERSIVTMLNPIDLILSANAQIPVDTLVQVETKLTLWNAARHIGFSLDSDDFVWHDTKLHDYEDD